MRLSIEGLCALVCAGAVVLMAGAMRTRAQDNPDVAQLETGREWLARCGSVAVAEADSSRQRATEGPCLAWIRGLLDMHAIYRGLGALERTPEGFCLPGTAALRDAAESIVRYIEARPAAHQVSARMLAYMALRQAFPCDGPE